MTALLDERGTPTPRTVIGRLLGGATHAEIAVSHVRVAAIDLRAGEAERIECCRVLLDHLDAHSLALPGLPAGAGAPVAARRVAERAAALLRFIESGRVEMRSAGVGAWRPDFSIYRGVSGAVSPATASTPAVCLVGAHYFDQPPTTPAFTCVIDDPAAIATALRRFEQLWEQGHDVAEAVTDAVARLAEAPVVGHG
jgi:hypothetical protein